MDLAGKVALITGAARRIGKELALGLADRGSMIAVHFRRSEGEAAALVERIRRGGGEADSFRADLREVADCERLVEEVIARFGRIDVLVNNASTFFPTPFGDVSEDQWDDLISVNLKAPFFCSQAAGVRMKSQGAGKIIHLADVAALRPWPGYVPYCVAKAGLVALTRALAKVMAPEVQVNAVAPGTVLPPEGTTPEEVEGWRRETPLGRLGTPGELVGTVLFLLERGDFMTGEVLYLDGGRHLV